MIELSEAEMSTLIKALDEYIVDRNRTVEENDMAIAVKLHNSLLDLVTKNYPDADILKPYHNYL